MADSLRRRQTLINAELIGERAKCVRSSPRFKQLDKAVTHGEAMIDLLYDLERELTA